MVLLSGQELIDKGIMTELNLRQAIQQGKITALDTDGFEPIDWKKKKADHMALQNLAKKPEKYSTRPGVKIYSAGIDSHGRQNKTPHQPSKVHERPRLIPDEQVKEWIPEAILRLNLNAEQKQTRVPPDQYYEIMTKWGASHEKRIALDACYKEEEIQEIADHPGNKLPPGTIEQFPEIIQFCTGLLLPHIKDVEKISFTRKIIVEKAKEFNIGQALARKIHTNMNPTIKGKQGRKSKNSA